MCSLACSVMFCPALSCFSFEKNILMTIALFIAQILRLAFKLQITIIANVIKPI